MPPTNPNQLRTWLRQQATNSRFQYQTEQNGDDRITHRLADDGSRTTFIVTPRDDSNYRVIHQPNGSNSRREEVISTTTYNSLGDALTAVLDRVTGAPRLRDAAEQHWHYRGVFDSASVAPFLKSLTRVLQTDTQDRTIHAFRHERSEITLEVGYRRDNTRHGSGPFAGIEPVIRGLRDSDHPDGIETIFTRGATSFRDATESLYQLAVDDGFPERLLEAPTTPTPTAAASAESAPEDHESSSSEAASAFVGVDTDALEESAFEWEPLDSRGEADDNDSPARSNDPQKDTEDNHPFAVSLDEPSGGSDETAAEPTANSDGTSEQGAAAKYPR